MRLNKTAHKPTMLMLSDCLPLPGGGERAERAWRLLRCACSTHQVYLASHAGQAVNLMQWQLIARMVERVHIEQRHFRRKLHPPIGGEAGDWIRTRRFDALLVTSPCIWPNGDTSFADYSLCDFTHDAKDLLGSSVWHAGLLSRLNWPLQRHTAARAKAPRDTAGFDYAIVSSERQVMRLKTQGTDTVVIPETNAEHAWTRLIHSIHSPTLSVPAVTVMPVTPQHLPVRKAA